MGRLPRGHWLPWRWVGGLRDRRHGSISGGEVGDGPEQDLQGCWAFLICDNLGPASWAGQNQQITPDLELSVAVLASPSPLDNETLNTLPPTGSQVIMGLVAREGVAEQLFPNLLLSLHQVPLLIFPETPKHEHDDTHFKNLRRQGA
jgi:hypothetical protein